MADNLQELKKSIEPLRNKIVNHSLYTHISDLTGLKIFMQHHVFAVWDFMSLLKSLQISLTCVSIPWLPIGNAKTRYLINEIVTGEESDVDEHGNRLSHFELYLEGMKQAGCDTLAIDTLISTLQAGVAINDALLLCETPASASAFVKSTFLTIHSGESCIMAAVFTFGREDLIPGMFTSMVEKLAQDMPDKMGIFKYYLDRHIEVDGGHHSNLAYEMTETLCGNDLDKWHKATEAVKASLQARIDLWDSIEKILLEEHVPVS